MPKFLVLVQVVVDQVQDEQQACHVVEQSASTLLENNENIKLAEIHSVHPVFDFALN